MVGRSGLNINRVKSNALLHNHRGIAAIYSVRYLGTDLCNSRKCYNTYEKGRIVMAEKIENLVFSVVYKLCNMVLIL